MLRYLENVRSVHLVGLCPEFVVDGIVRRSLRTHILARARIVHVCSVLQRPCSKPSMIAKFESAFSAILDGKCVPRDVQATIADLGVATCETLALTENAAAKLRDQLHDDIGLDRRGADKGQASLQGSESHHNAKKTRNGAPLASQLRFPRARSSQYDVRERSSTKRCHRQNCPRSRSWNGEQQKFTKENSKQNRLAKPRPRKTKSWQPTKAHRQTGFAMGTKRRRDSRARGARASCRVQQNSSVTSTGSCRSVHSEILCARYPMRASSKTTLNGCLETESRVVNRAGEATVAP